MKIWLPILCFILFAPWSSAIDLAVSHYFYDPTQSFADNDFFFRVYLWGFYPSWILFFIAVGFFFASYFRPSWIKWRQPAMVLILTYVVMVGAGVELIKSIVGRPRPRNVTEFNGEHAFRPFYFGERSGKSFPSGHAASGFYFLALVPVGRRLGNSYIVYTGAALGIILGGLLSWTRMAQGGHFFTDCLGSLLLVWVVANLLDYWLAPKYS
jgi:lipid A 4'-phosphatase